MDAVLSAAWPMPIAWPNSWTATVIRSYVVPLICHDWVVLKNMSPALVPPLAGGAR